MYGRHLCRRATVDHRDVASETDSGARRVHRHIAAADDTYALPFPGRHQVKIDSAFIIGIDLMKKIGRLAHAPQLAARHVVHVLRNGRARTHEDGIVAFGKERIHILAVLSDDSVGNKVDTELRDLLNLRAHDLLRQTILRYAPHEHAARLGLCLIDRHGKAFARQVAGNGQSGRP